VNFLLKLVVFFALLPFALFAIFWILFIVLMMVTPMEGLQ